MSWLTAAWAPKLVMGLLLTLALSVGANALLGSAWLAARDRAAVADQRTTEALGAAQTCSAAVDALQQAAADRKSNNALLVAAAEKAARAAQDAANDLLRRPPPVPGDDCASARQAADEWLGQRP